MAGRLSSFLRNPFSFLFARSSQEERLSAYVIREHDRGRPLAEILDDPYVRNRANPQAVPRTVYGNYVITCTPTSAVVTHRNATTTTVNGKEQTSYTRSVHVMEKRGGRWQVVGNAGHPLTDAQVLLYIENDWNEAAKKRDAAWYERNYADDATHVMAGMPTLRTKADVIASTKDGKSVIESIELSEPNVRVDGNVAIVTGLNRVRGRDEQGKPFDRRVRFTDTFIKRDGRWQVWASQGTIIP